MLLVMFVLNLYITPQHFIDVSTFNLRFNNHRKDKKAKRYNFSLQTLINIISNHNFQREAYKKSNENFCKRMVSIKNLRMSKKWNYVTVIFRLQYCIMFYCQFEPNRHWTCSSCHHGNKWHQMWHAKTEFWKF